MQGTRLEENENAVTLLFWPLAGAAAAAAMSWFAGASLVRSAAALVIIYACGYVTGSLLVAPRPGRTAPDGMTLSLGIVRLLAGLFLTSVGFLLSLQSPLPWFTGPVALLAIAVWRHGRAAFVPPRLDLWATFPGRRSREGEGGRRPASRLVDGTIAGLVAMIVLAPPVISAMRMAQGDFPPVFFHVDVPYFLEKVHALVQTETFPPESLGVLDGRRAYHFGIHGLAALVSRGSGIAPHHAVFLLVVPLLAVGIVAAAVVLARAVSPAVPFVISMPLLLISVPSLWYDYWASVWPRLQLVRESGTLDPLNVLIANWEMWGVTSNIQNLAGHFLVLASVGAIANAPLAGWRLPAFLIGSAVVFKSPVAVGLVAGISLLQAFRAAMARSLGPLKPLVGTAAVFGLVYGAFWILPPVPAELKTELVPFYQLGYVIGHGGVSWFLYDVAWLLLPALVILPARLASGEGRSVPYLLLAVAPFIVVNLLQSVDLRKDFGIGSMNEDDWRQIMLPVPLLLHAFVLSVIGPRWSRLGAGRRSPVLLAVLLVALPPLYVGVRYARVLALEPESGHEFADNREIAPALAIVPREGTIVVTNDLRYPADGFRRENRQMQIPSLFGHQAFAVNYVYEAYAFSAERLELQKLLEAEQWTDAIAQAARANRWTHLLIRKDYPHPAAIPLERVFENESYSVYRF
jgi:hypothetical protein